MSCKVKGEGKGGEAVRGKLKGGKESHQFSARGHAATHRYTGVAHFGHVKAGPCAAAACSGGALQQLRAQLCQARAQKTMVSFCGFVLQEGMKVEGKEGA